MSTNFAYGLKARGAPLEPGSGARYTGWWGVNTWFVDYDHGSDSNTGKDMTAAFINLQTAINTASAGDVIYIRNRDQDITSTDPEAILPASTTNWSTPESKPHLSIIGATNVSHVPSEAGRFAVYLKGHATANTTAVMDVQTPFILLENLSFHRGASTAGGLVTLNGNSTSLRAAGAVVNSCLFRLSNHAVGALYNLDNWWVTVYNSEFHDCRVGIDMYGSQSTMRRCRISNCLFRNQTATSVDMNIRIHGSSTQDITIDNCDFTCNAPNYTGGTNKYISIEGTSSGAVIRCNFPTDTTEGTVGVTLSSMDAMDCHQGIAVTNDEAFGAT